MSETIKITLVRSFCVSVTNTDNHMCVNICMSVKLVCVYDFPVRLSVRHTENHTSVIFYTCLSETLTITCVIFNISAMNLIFYSRLNDQTGCTRGPNPPQVVLDVRASGVDELPSWPGLPNPWAPAAGRDPPPNSHDEEAPRR